MHDVRIVEKNELLFFWNEKMYAIEVHQIVIKDLQYNICSVFSSYIILSFLKITVLVLFAHICTIHDLKEIEIDGDEEEKFEFDF